MSSSDRTESPNPTVRRLVLVCAAVSLGVLQACTVRPLYSSAPMSATADTSFAQELALVSVKPVASREAQEVRNHLIFLLNSGQGQAGAGKYSLNLGVTRLSESSALIQVGDENEPTAATLTMRSDYVLTASDGTRVATGTRSITSSYDVPRQEFAALRAYRDAENRAARELAEVLRLALAQDLARAAQ